MSRNVFGNSLPLETAEVDREDHKEHLPESKLPESVINFLNDPKIISSRPVIFVNWTAVSGKSGFCFWFQM